MSIITDRSFDLFSEMEESFPWELLAKSAVSKRIKWRDWKARFLNCIPWMRILLFSPFFLYIRFTFALDFTFLRVLAWRKPDLPVTAIIA